MIGLVGGVGPEAGRLLHGFIIEETARQKNIGCDQDHLMLNHISASPIIPDRTQFLLGNEYENPAIGAFKVIEALSGSAAIFDKSCVVGVPCNTFHAPAIFGELERLLTESEISNIELLNMINETVNHIRANLNSGAKIGLMSTTGTRHVGIYREPLEKAGYTVVEVDPAKQSNLHDTIYNSDWGIKAVSPVSEKAKTNFEMYAQQLIDGGAETIILGCTEIPLALPGEEFKGVSLLDPMRVIAKSLVARALAV